MRAETIVCTKGDLSKIIKWSSSRYNERSKREVINEIVEIFKRRAEIELLEQVYTTGSFSEGGHQRGKRYGGSTGWSYTLAIKNGAATLTTGNTIYFLKGRRG